MPLGIVAAGAWIGGPGARTPAGWVALGGIALLSAIAMWLGVEGPRGRALLARLVVGHLVGGTVACLGWLGVDHWRYRSWRESLWIHERGAGCHMNIRRVIAHLYEGMWYDDAGILRYRVSLPAGLDTDDHCCPGSSEPWSTPYVWVGDSLPVVLARRRNALLMFCPASNATSARRILTLRGMDHHEHGGVDQATLIAWLEQAIAQGERGEIPYTPAAMATLRRELTARLELDHALGAWLDR